MVKGRIAVLIFGVFIMTLILQYHRSDGFLVFLQNKNATVDLGELKEFPAGKQIATERYLVVYDSEVQESILLKNNILTTLQYAKKYAEAVKMQEFQGVALRNNRYDCVVVAHEELDQMGSIQSLIQFVESGGNIFFALRPLNGNALQQISPFLGIRSFRDTMRNDVVGLELHENLLVHGKGYKLDDKDFTNSSLDLSLDEQATLLVSSIDGLPLAWEKSWGKGKFIFYNGTSLGEKVNRGLLLGLLGKVKDTFVYPVMGLKILNIDDFPAPLPDGNEEIIFKYYGMTVEDFYRSIWWPDMVSIANRYDLKYTALFIESYVDRVEPPFYPDNRNAISQDLLVYGREILKSGGELGIHGYNHQPLALYNWIPQDLGYIPWPNKESMEISLQEAQRHFAEVYPHYSLKAYVPPSNILSPEGREVLVETLPDLKIIASLLVGDTSTYSQEFTRSEDGILEIPRITSGFLRHTYNDWFTMNIASQIGVFSHFVHPDDLLDVQRSQGKPWDELYEGFDDLLQKIDISYPWLQGTTLSEAGEHLIDFLDMKYTVEEKESEIIITSGGFRGKSHFIIRSEAQLKAGINCEVTALDDSHYIVTVFENEARLILESEGSV